jgi:thiol:disulfide interchange protein DsbD
MPTTPHPRILVVACSGLGALIPANVVHAQSPTVPDFGNPARKALSVQEEAAQAVSVRLIAESTALQPGNPSTLGVTFDIAEGWNLYWRNPGESGAAITVKFDPVPGVTIGEPQWPAPERHLLPGELLDYVYTKRVTLLFPVTIASTVTDQIALRARVQWLVCREACVPGERRVELRLPLSNAPSPSADRPLFDQTRARLPRTIADQPSPAFTAAWEGRSLRLACAGAVRMTFFPYEDEPLPADALAAGHAASDRLALHYPAAEPGNRVRGVLEIRRESLTTFHLVESPPVP